MRKIIFLSFLAGFFLVACNNSSSTIPSTDSVKTAGSSHGISLDTSLNTGKLKTDSIYSGEKVERYDNGVIYRKGEIQGGVRVGTWLSFYKDGKPWSQGTYVDGLREGYGVSWFEDGKKSSEGYYHLGKPVGKWTYWDEYGTVKEVDLGGK